MHANVMIYVLSIIIVVMTMKMFVVRLSLAMKTVAMGLMMMAMAIRSWAGTAMMTRQASIPAPTKPGTPRTMTAMASSTRA